MIGGRLQDLLLIALKDHELSAKEVVGRSPGLLPIAGSCKTDKGTQGGWLRK